MRTVTIPIIAEPVVRTPDCADHDEDCAPPHDYAACWAYAPERGMCPYLRSEAQPRAS